MVACCPLQGCDEYATVADVVVRTARKQHQCEECRDPIRPSVRYEHASVLFDGHWSTIKTCLACVEIRDHFACGNGFLYGTLWDDLIDNFFPHMTCGGPCMAGLSPLAKAKLIDERMAWYLERDEVNDSQWEGDAWRPGPLRAFFSPSTMFVAPAYAFLEYEPCGQWNCRVDIELDILRRGGRAPDGGLIYRDVATGERRIRAAEQYCNRLHRYPPRHTESIVPDGGPGFGDLEG